MRQETRTCKADRDSRTSPKELEGRNGRPSPKGQISEIDLELEKNDRPRI